MKFLKSIGYIVISFILWLIVEYITVWAQGRMDEWQSHMPWVFIQYLFIILVFWFILFKKNWSHKKSFWAMVILMYVWELLWRNFLLLNPITFIPASILLIMMWGFLTFIPFWLVQGKLGKHKKLAIFYCLWPVLGFLMAIIL